MVQTLARCRECGLPGMLAKGLEWRHGGVIVPRRARSFRLALIDERTVSHITSTLAGTVGDEAIRNAETAAVRAAASNLMRGLKGRPSRYGAVKKRLLEAMEDYSLLLGMGRIELEKFTPGEGGSMLLRKPFDLGVTVAGVTAVLEEIDQCSYHGEVAEASKGVLRLVLEVAESRVGERSGPGFEIAQTRNVEGRDHLEACSQCGLPLSLAGLCWDEVYGVIRAGSRGRRVCLFPAIILESLQRLGEVSNRRGAAFEEAVFEAARSSLGENEEDVYENAAVLPGEGGPGTAFEMIEMRGWGKVVSGGLQGDEWRVEVLNPVNDSLIAGWLRSLYTVAVGREPLLQMSGDVPISCFELKQGHSG